MKIKENELKNIISNVIKESFMGLNGQDLERWGIKNPADEYPVNYAEVKQKCEEFLPVIRRFCEYIGGIEEDAENGVQGTNGVYLNMSMRSMWNNDDDEKYQSDELRELYFKLSSAIDSISDFIDWCGYKK